MSFTLRGHDLAHCVALKLMYARSCNLRVEMNETWLKNVSKCFETHKFHVKKNYSLL